MFPHSLPLIVYLCIPTAHQSPIALLLTSPQPCTLPKHILYPALIPPQMGTLSHAFNCKDQAVAPPYLYILHSMTGACYRRWQAHNPSVKNALGLPQKAHDFQP